MKKLPVIDISPLRSLSIDRNEDNYKKMLCQIDSASREFGFYYIVNHGIPMDAIIAGAKGFFDLPQATKDKLKRLPDTPFRGYFAMNEYTKNKLDLKEGFDYAAWPTVEGSTVWPDNGDHLRDIFLDYFSRASTVCEQLFDAYAGLLGQRDGYFGEFFREGEHLSFTRLNYYPSTTEEGFGVNPHQDGVALTLLRQDDGNAALQVYVDEPTEYDEFQSSDESKWITVDPVPGAFVVNVGTMLEVWSNKRYKAALHRVLPSRGGHVRYSAPFFYSPSPSALVVPILLTPDEKPQYQSINYGEYRNLLFRSFNEDIPLNKQARLPNYRIIY